MQDISKERLGAVSDGVFAIAATILVLELKLPEGRGLSHEDILSWLHVFVGWLVSFAMIAMLWFEQHFQLRRAEKLSQRLAGLVFLQLALISLIPFASGLVAVDPDDLLSSVIFNLVMVANGLCSAKISQMLARTPAHLSNPDDSHALTFRARTQIGSYLVVAVIGLLGAATQHPFIGVLLWLIIPLYVGRRFNATPAR
jgi:uncharacterized membrane protein